MCFPVASDAKTKKPNFSIEREREKELLLLFHPLHFFSRELILKSPIS